jgi:outer membrane protein TolC
LQEWKVSAAGLLLLAAGLLLLAAEEELALLIGEKEAVLPMPLNTLNEKPLINALSNENPYLAFSHNQWSIAKLQYNLSKEKAAPGLLFGYRQFTQFSGN